MKTETKTAPPIKLITGQVIYLGPHIGPLGLYYHKGYTDGIEEQLYEWIAQCPAIGELIVPIEQCGPVLRELDFDYAHNMRGQRGKFVTFYRAVQQWLASHASKPSQQGITLEKQHA